MIWTPDYFKEIYTKYANTLKLEDRKKAMAELENYSFIMINVDNIKNVTQVQEDIEALWVTGAVTVEETIFGFCTRILLQDVIHAGEGIEVIIGEVCDDLLHGGLRLQNKCFKKQK